MNRTKIWKKIILPITTVGIAIGGLPIVVTSCKKKSKPVDTMTIISANGQYEASSHVGERGEHQFNLTLNDKPLANDQVTWNVTVNGIANPNITISATGLLEWNEKLSEGSYMLEISAVKNDNVETIASTRLFLRILPENYEILKIEGSAFIDSEFGQGGTQSYTLLLNDSQLDNSSANWSITVNGSTNDKIRINNGILSWDKDLGPSSYGIEIRAEKASDPSVYNTLIVSLNITSNLTIEIQGEKQITSEIGVGGHHQYSVHFSGYTPNDKVVWSIELPETLSPSQVSINQNGLLTWTDNIIKVNGGYNFTITAVADFDSSTTASINVNLLITDKRMYGLPVAEDKDLVTGRPYTTQAVTLDQARQNAQDWVTNYLTNERFQSVMSNVINTYVNTYIYSRDNTCELNSDLSETNLILNEDKTVTGNIKMVFDYTQKLTGTLASSSREIGNQDVVNFVFENSPVEAYINTAFTNMISFRIKSKYMERKVTTTVQYQSSYDVANPDEYFNLDSEKDLTLLLKNSLYTINFDNYLNNMYLYNKDTTSANQKKFILWVIQNLIGWQGKLVLVGTSWKTNGVLPLQGSFKLNVPSEISMEDIDTNFLKLVLGELNPLFYFLNTSPYVDKNSRRIQIDTVPTIVKYDPANTIVDMSSGEYNQDNLYSKDLRDLAFIQNIYSDQQALKNKVIENTASFNIPTDYNAYLQGLSDAEKADLIYKIELPYVSYGQIDGSTAWSTGYINGKLLCDGYANFFTYTGVLLNIKTFKLEGWTKVNSDPENPDEPGLHAWNAILVDGEWLFCDPTWDDSMSPSSPTYKKDNFCKTMAEFYTTTSHLDVTNWSNGAILPFEVPNYPH